MDIINKLLNGEVVLQNVPLTRGVKKLWRSLLVHKRVMSVFLGHVYAHGKCTVPDRGNDVADRVAKLGADDKFTPFGEFSDIAELHLEYQKKFDLIDTDDVLVGMHTGIEGSDEEILVYVDGACDPVSKACGHAFNLSDGDCEHSGMGAIAPRLDPEVTGASAGKFELKASLLATITALECAVKVNCGHKKPANVFYLRKSLGKELVMGRLSTLAERNMLHQEIVHAHALISQLTMLGSEVTFKVSHKDCPGMNHVRS